MEQFRKPVWLALSKSPKSNNVDTDVGDVLLSVQELFLLSDTGVGTVDHRPVCLKFSDTHGVTGHNREPTVSELESGTILECSLVQQSVTYLVC